ncbi:MAG: hypothetical protein H0Z39_03465 [Peptococcaceae bacterium]|nr:hypothetical protein [Peptococcaceae bacterium]
MITLLLILGLFGSLLFLFYTLTTGRSPIERNLKAVIKNFMFCSGIPLVVALVFFLVGNILFATPVAGLVWGILGWFVPLWVIDAAKGRRQARLRAISRDFITSAAGLYSANQVTSEVITTAGKRLPEPLGSEFRDMAQKYSLDPYVLPQKLFEDLAEKYGLNEFKAVGQILDAANIAGGPRAAGRGLKRLGRALRLRDRLATERQKAMLEPAVAAVVVICLMIMGLVLDVTVLRPYFAAAGRWVLSASSVLTVAMIFAVVRLFRFKDLF